MKKIGVLIVVKEGEKQLCVIEFLPSGMLVSRVIAGNMHVYSMREYTKLLGQPLYVKHTDILAREKVLPREVLIAESKNLAALINEKLKAGPNEAIGVEWESEEQEGEPPDIR